MDAVLPRPGRCGVEPEDVVSAAPVVEVVVPGDDVDVVSLQLWALGATALAELPDAVGRVLLRAGMPDQELARAAARTVSARHAARVISDDPDGAWWDGWRPYAQPVRSGRVTVQPVSSSSPAPAAGPEPGSDGVHVVLDAARSFGTGAHPTTRLALAALSALPLQGRSVLDLGSGSGVLSVAAALLGAREVTAVDIDERARETTRANAERNGIQVRIADRADGLEGYDVVVANLPAEAWEALTTPAGRACGPDGTLIATGFLAERWATLAAHVVGGSMEEYGADVLEGWECRLLRRQGRAPRTVWAVAAPSGQRR